MAVLPAFAHARGAKLAAFVSDDAAKLRELGKRYRVSSLYSYEQYDECLKSGEIDAVFIALPNDMHAEYTIRAAKAGIHVLCEKPMAVRSQDCRAMITAAKKAKIKLMIAYRLHLERANLAAAKLVQSGRLGDARIYSANFTMQVRDRDNIRLEKQSGGPAYDIGIYCLNAARYLFRSEPTHVIACARSVDEARFREVDEMMSVTLVFPGERLATFTFSFGASDVSSYRVIGTRGDLRVEPAFGYSKPLVHHLTIDGRTTTRRYPRRDQFAAELLHFSRCIRDDQDPGPSGTEGWIDVRILEAIQRSARTGRLVRLPALPRIRRPSLADEIRRAPVRKPTLVRVRSPRG